ncbi:RNA-binding cell elongation regulator Jag/EloR [Thermodesulfobacteriota bacterium]
MSPWLEFEDKSVEKAVDKASAQLNIPKEKLKHDVISYGSSGIFGLVGAKKAKIRVSTPEISPVKVPAEVDTAGSASDPGEADAGIDDATEPISKALDDQAPMFSADPIDLGTEVLQKIIDLITTDAKVVVNDTSDRILFKVEGGNPAILIGRRGQTLEAIQYIVDKIVNKRVDGRVRLQIDIEGYIETRKSNLKKLAARMAEKSKRTGRPVTIGQMNAHDRRIIHLTLKDDNKVRTQSMGDGYYRKLVIFPKKNYSRRK